jgi:hypothetical protein
VKCECLIFRIDLVYKRGYLAFRDDQGMVGGGGEVVAEDYGVGDFQDDSGGVQVAEWTGGLIVHVIFYQCIQNGRKSNLTLETVMYFNSS